MTDLVIKPDTSTCRDITVNVTVDGELLLEARRQISAESIDAAVREALRRLVDEERAKRRAALERLHQMYEDGLFDFGPDDQGGR